MSDSRPQFADIDAWGATHRGHVRKDNQDCVFAGSLARTDRVRPISLAEEDRLPRDVERPASLAVVADGGEAARVAVRELTAAIARFFGEGVVAGPDDPDVFSRPLQEAALSCHEHLLQRARDEGGGRKFATTLTLFPGLWPHACLLQVGDGEAGQAAALYPLCTESTELGIGEQMEEAAGRGAAAGQDWEAAERHLTNALRQAHELPDVFAQPDARLARAEMLIARGQEGDHTSARSLLEEAVPMYERAGRTRGVRTCRTLLESLT